MMKTLESDAKSILLTRIYSRKLASSLDVVQWVGEPANVPAVSVRHFHPVLSCL